MFLGGTCKHFLLCFQSCYLETGVEKGLLMSFRKEGNSISHISRFLVQNVLFLALRITWTKFDSKFVIGIFLGYSSSNKAYRVYNNRTLYLEESMHITFEKTWNDKIDEILNDVKESVQHLILNYNTPMEDNNEEMNKINQAQVINIKW